MATVIKLKRSTTASAVPTTSDLQDGEIAVNITDKKVFMRSGSDIVTVANFNDSSIDLSSISEDVKPSVTETYDLGSPTKRWNELYLAGTTINLGGSTISSDGTGQIQYQRQVLLYQATPILKSLLVYKKKLHLLVKQGIQLDQFRFLVNQVD